MNRGEVHVWRVRLGDEPRAHAHRALRDILARFTTADLEFAAAPNGKPWLPGAPELKFNLSRSRDIALVAVTLGAEVGVDIERFRPLPEYAAIAERFFPPGEEAPTDERDFFRRWTRLEALLKASGIGLYGMGAGVEGEWTVHEIDAAEGYAAAVAMAGPPIPIAIHDY
jgi:4'-phosphopantetheinyl transferase